jgi:hypothetical protein
MPGPTKSTVFYTPSVITTYKTAVLPFVLHWCQTWSLAAREEYRLRVFENTVPRRIFG